MKNTEPHDVRLVYLACSWLVAHRGHFLNNVDKENIEQIKDFTAVYSKFTDYFTQVRFCAVPWECENIAELEASLKQKKGINAKY